MRQSSGASFVLVISIIGGFALVFSLFCLSLTGMFGSYHEQRSAIEAAALVAAKDISMVVIDDPNFGLIGLSDSAPINSATAATDGFDTSVRSINTIFGTIRLDLIIADYMNDPIMTQLAMIDYNNALIAQKNLNAALAAAAAPYGTGQDVNGNIINPTKDALAAYNANNVHLTAGQTAILVPGSLVLSLGYLNGISSRTPIPQPQSAAQLSSSNQQSQGCYSGNVVINYKSQSTGATTPFVFAPLSSNATLVDFRNFQNTLPGLPFSTPTVVKVDADERFEQNGNTKTIMHACATGLAGTVIDQRPHPGAFTITFTDGPLPEISQAGDLINNLQLQADPVDVMQTPSGGDYPQTALGMYAMPFLPDPDSFHPTFEHVFSVALYDWIRRGGTSINVQSLLSVLQTPLTFGTGGPQQQRFHFTSAGTVTMDSVAWGQTNLSVSNNQFRAISGLALISSNSSTYDVQITDFGRTTGRTNGGAHAGEPLDYVGSSGSNPAAATYVPGTMYENLTWPYEEFVSGAGIRQTYNNEGIAVDITLRKRP